MSILAIPFRTLRMHDSPFLELEEKPIFKFIIDENVLPSKSPFDEKLNSKVWSIPMAWFYINCLEYHIQDLKDSGYIVDVIFTNDVAKSINKLLKSKSYKKIVTDYTHDGILPEHKNKKLVRIETTSMLNWYEENNYILAKKIFRNNAYAQTNKLKNYIHNYLKKVTDIKTYNVKRSSKLHSASIDLRKIKEKINKLANSQNPKIKLFSFLLFDDKQMFDKQILDFAKISAHITLHKDWNKPFTAANLGLYEYSENLNDNSTKLSPFLSSGVLSHRILYKFLTPYENQPKLGSGADQLLFSEVWYAASVAVGDDYWSYNPGWWHQYPHRIVAGQRLDSKVRGTPGLPPTDKIMNMTWRQFNNNSDKDLSLVWKWISGNLKGVRTNDKTKKNVEWSDTNESMQQLLSEGWIHHLRRHLVADVLCRGELHIHFIYGMLWFKRTLIDHDAVKNRSNWMWLSTAAHSSTQTIRNYHAIDYIQRHSTKLEILSTRYFFKLWKEGQLYTLV